MAHTGKAGQDKIKMFVMVTPSHQELKEDWFLKSIKDDLDVVFYHAEQRCATASYMEQGWNETFLDRVQYLIARTKENRGSIVVSADVDIQFFAPVQNILLRALEGKDLVIQKDSKEGELCAGFFAYRCNDKILKFFEAVRTAMSGGRLAFCDQHYFNRFLRFPALTGTGFLGVGRNALLQRVDKLFKGRLLALIAPHLINDFGIKWGYLDRRFFSPGLDQRWHEKNPTWSPGQALAIPGDIVLHHANFTKGVPDKIAQLKYVKSVVEREEPEAL